MATDQVALPADPKSPGLARRFVTERLQAWGHADLVAAAELVTSELVTNVVRHVEAPIAVEIIDLGDSVVIAVVDPASDLPAVPPPTPTASGGRGLAIVHGLARAWGAAPIPTDGKVVWARLPAPGARKQ